MGIDERPHVKAGDYLPKTAFFGARGVARSVCYVVDRSGSMLDSFEFVKMELKRSIGDLQANQSFHVIFFSEGDPVEYPAKRLLQATRGNKKMVFDWIDWIANVGQTHPEAALLRAMEVEPELIYFLSDGDFDRKIIHTLRRINAERNVAINTIAFLFRAGEERLKQIADENGGTYKFVSEEELGL